MSFMPSFMTNVLRMPLAGDVSTDIESRLYSHDYKGVPEIERAVLKEVAGYGKQLGWMTEALLALAEAQNMKLPKLESMNDQIVAVKKRIGRDRKAEAEAAIAALKAADPDEWATLMRAEVEKIDAE